MERRKPIHLYSHSVEHLNSSSSARVWIGEECTCRKLLHSLGSQGSPSLTPLWKVPGKTSFTLLHNEVASLPAPSFPPAVLGDAASLYHPCPITGLFPSHYDHACVDPHVGQLTQCRVGVLRCVPMHYLFQHQ